MRKKTSMMDMTQIGKRIREQRELKGLKQEFLAERVGVNPHYISEIENGRKHPSADLLISLAIQLNMSLDYMIFGKTPIEDCPASLLNLIEMCSPAQKEHLEVFTRYLIDYDRFKEDQ